MYWQSVILRRVCASQPVQLRQVSSHLAGKARDAPEVLLCDSGTHHHNTADPQNAKTALTEAQFYFLLRRRWWTSEESVNEHLRRDATVMLTYVETPYPPLSAST